MDRIHAAVARVTHPVIPPDGLAEVLSRWVGRGGLYQALAAPCDPETTTSWSPLEVEARAHRILFERLKPSIARLPGRAREWVDALPAARIHEAVVCPAPSAGTSWSETRIRFGWPPTAFAIRRSTRSADDLMATALSWTLGRLAQVRLSAVKSYSEADQPVRAQLDAAERARALEPLSYVSSVRPGHQDLLSLRRAGRPWSAIVEIAGELRRLDGPNIELSEMLLVPDDEVRWRFFHLAVLGVLLLSLRQNGCLLTSLRPIGGGSNGPAFQVTDSSGTDFQLWFEAAGAWQATGIKSPYAEATSGLALKERALGVDLLLIEPNARALAIECKYSASPEFVARAGYYQAATYSLELSSRLAPETISIAVGPEGVVRSASFSSLRSGYVGTCPPSALNSVVRAFLRRGDVSVLSGATPSLTDT